MFGVRKISYICYQTPDLEKSVEYYSNILGLSVILKDSGRAFLASTIEHHSVVLEKGSEPKCTRIGFQIGAGDDLGKMHRHLERCGVQVTLKTDSGPEMTEMLTFLDPKGTEIEIFNPPPVSKQKFTASGIVPSKLGHVAFHVENAEDMTNFYCDILGFRVSDWLERRFSFLRCGSDHHTVNFIGSGTVRHDHTAFELRDWSHMEQACDYLSRNGYRLIWGPGRHGIGHNLFTYHRNPDGLIVELFAELDTMSNEGLGYFDPRPWHPDVPQRPKTWEMTPRLVNLWREEYPPEEMLKV